VGRSLPPDVFPESVAMRNLICTVALIALPLVASAQPAPPPPAPPPPPPPRHEGSAELSFLSTTGNASAQTLGLGGDYFFRPEAWVFRTRTAYVRNESDDELTAESFLLLFRAEHLVTDRLSVFGEYGYLRDRFAGIEHRNQLLGGVAYKLITAAPHLLVADAAIGYANEQRTLGDDLSSAVWNGGLAYTLKLSANADLTNDFRFNQSLAEAGDWRVGNVVGVTARLTTLLSLKFSNTVRFVNQPPPGFDTTDTITAVALVAKFPATK
jgi:putative salt-induced outer membrane protein